MEPRVLWFLALFLLTHTHSVTSQTSTSSLDSNSTLSTTAPSSASTEISPSSSAAVSASSPILLDSSSSTISSSASSISSPASSASLNSTLSVTEMTSSVAPTAVVVTTSSSSVSTISPTTTLTTTYSLEQTSSTSSSHSDVTLNMTSLHSDVMATVTSSISGTALTPTMSLTTQTSLTTGYTPLTASYMSLPTTNLLMTPSVMSNMTTDMSTSTITVTLTTPTTTPTTTTPPPLKDITLAFVFSYNNSAIEGLNTSSVEYQQFRNRTLQALSSIYNLTLPMDITNLTISNGSLAVVLKITGTAKEISDNQNSIAARTRSIQTGQQNVTFDNLPATATQVFINGAKFDAQASPCVQAAIIQACQYPLVCVVLADNITTTCSPEPHSKNKQGLLIGLPVGLLLYWFLCVVIAALIYSFVKQRRKVRTRTTDFNDVMLFDESLVPLDSFPKKKLRGVENPAMTEQSTGTNGSSEQHKM